MRLITRLETLVEVMGVSNYWNEIRTGLEWNETIQNSKTME